MDALQYCPQSTDQIENELLVYLVIVAHKLASRGGNRQLFRRQHAEFVLAIDAYFVTR